MHHPVLSELYVYPVKSLAGIKVSTWSVTAKGFLHDRKWMLIDRNNHFLSQRQLPKMALIKTHLTDSELILSTASSDQIVLPLDPITGHNVITQIWHDCCLAKSTSTQVDQWLSDFLGIQCRLVYQPNEVFRPVDPLYSKPTDQLNFSDGFPFLILSKASLATLNSEMRLQLDIQRFRPNLVIAQCSPYAEDSWREIRINQIHFRLPKPCSRCRVPTIHPETAETGKEPLKTLNRFRKWNKRVYFGQNALHNESGTLSIGNKVYIIRTGSKQPPL